MTRDDRIAALLEGVVRRGALAGIATLVWRDGQVVQWAAVGCRDVAAKLPVERDTLFRIASMTKPITSTAALMLLEEGRFALDDPIARWAPEFSRMRVLRSPSCSLDETDAAGAAGGPGLCLRRAGSLVDAGRLCRLRADVRGRGCRGWSAIAATGDAGDDDRQPFD